jgi:hypothetical protein
LKLLDLQVWIKSYHWVAQADWMSLGDQDFEDFCTAQLQMASGALVPPAVPAPPIPLMPTPTAVTTPYAMRQDYKHHSDLTQRSFFSQWMKEVKACHHPQFRKPIGLYLCPWKPG